MSKKSKAELMIIKTHIKILEQRINRLKPILQKRFMNGKYNITESRRILSKIKKAKVLIAEIEFI